MEGSDGGEGVVDREGGEQGMVDSGGGEGVNAYPMEYKMTTTIASSSSSPTWCHVADCNTVPLARCVVRGSGDVVWLSFPLVGAGRRLTVVGGVVVVFGIAGRSHSFVGRSFVGRWLSFAGRWVVGVVFGSRRCLWWCKWRDVACG